MNQESKLALKVSILSAVFTLILLMLANYYFNRTWNLFGNATKAQLFTAQGESTIKAVPDEAQISFAVNITAKTLKDAQDKANTKTNMIVSDLKNAGIAENDIKTSNYNSYPNYGHNNLPNSSAAISAPTYPVRNNGTIESYTVNENVDITIHDISKVNSVIDLITKDGAENVNGPNFTFSDESQNKLKDRARIAAIDDAKQKARSLAAAAGIRLGKVVNVEENSTPFAVPMLLKSAAEGGGNASAPTQISPGENSITETVTLSYEIR